MAFPPQLRRAELYCDFRALALPAAFADDNDPRRITPESARRPDLANITPCGTMKMMKALCQVGNGENYPSLPPKKLHRKERSSGVYGWA
jgi:hypothetical protein